MPGLTPGLLSRRHSGYDGLSARSDTLSLGPPSAGADATARGVATAGSSGHAGAAEGGAQPQHDNNSLGPSAGNAVAAFLGSGLAGAAAGGSAGAADPGSSHVGHASGTIHLTNPLKQLVGAEKKNFPPTNFVHGDLVGFDDCDWSPLLF
jgi:hypothetical protein